MKVIKSGITWLLPIVVGLLIAAVIKQYAFELVRIDGPSMNPNLVDNERTALIKLGKLQRGSVIVFNAKGVDPGATTNIDYVKRVIGLPGDEIISKDGNIYVNGKKVNQGYINISERTLGTGNWNLSS